jgi:hypothetical protein
MVTVKVTVSTTLPVTFETAWEMLHTPAVFRSVSAPFTIFRERPGQPLPPRFLPDTDYTVSVFAGGIVPLGTQIIRLEDTVTSPHSRSTVDVGRGVSGVLGLLRNWRHHMALERISEHQTGFRDQLSVNASWLTPMLWLGFSVFWRWRALRLRQVAKKRFSPVPPFGREQT